MIDLELTYAISQLDFYLSSAHFPFEMLSELLLRKERKLKDETDRKCCNGVVRFNRRVEARKRMKEGMIDNNSSFPQFFHREENDSSVLHLLATENIEFLSLTQHSITKQ